MNRAVTAAGKRAVVVPPKEEEEDDDDTGGGGESREAGIDQDALMGVAKVPVGFRPIR